MPENVKAAGFPGLDREHKLDGKKKKIHAKQNRGNRRIETGDCGKFLGKSGERKAQARATFVTTSCCDAHEGTAGGAEFGAGLFVSAAE